MIYPIAGPTTDDDASTEPKQRPVQRVLGIVPSAVRASLVANDHADASADAGHAPMTTIAPVKLDAVSRVASRLSRTVCDARLVASVQTLFDVDALSARVVDNDEAVAYEEPAVLDISLGASTMHSAAHVQIALDLRAYPSLAIIASPEREASSPAASSADLALRQAVAGVLLEPLLAQIARAGLQDPRVTGLRRGRLNAAASVALSLTFDGRRHDVRIAADIHALDQLDAAFRHQDEAQTPQPQLDVPGSLIVGVKPLSVDTLQSLDAGDVLLRALFPGWSAALLSSATGSNTSPEQARPRAVAAWGTPGLTRLCAVVELDGRSPVIVKEPNMSEELDPASADAGLAVAQPDNPIHIGELELPVQFEIDTVALPLAQLSSLGPGYVVELPVPVADARLRLVAHGQTIGYGELVTVGEHLGIRIIRMAHRHGPVQ